MAARRLNTSNPFPNSFIGRELCSIDSRGRSKFPARFRKMLSRESEKRLVIAPGQGEYLIALPRDFWETLHNRYDPTPYDDETELDKMRDRYHDAEEVIFDSQGRITIPEDLLQYARISKEFVVRSMRHWFEIWNPDLLTEWRKKMRPGKERSQES
jgi:MraZ protein